jgi:hypothetical protein
MQMFEVTSDDYFPHMSRFDFVDEAADVIAMREIWMFANAHDRAAHGLIEIREAAKCIGGF